MNFLRLFIPLVWLILAFYLVGIGFNMLNEANTVSNIIGFMGMFLISYLSVYFKLGLKLIKTKN